MSRLLLAALALLAACDPPPECPPPEPQGCRDQFFAVKNWHEARCYPGARLTLVNGVAICNCPTADGGTPP